MTLQNNRNALKYRLKQEEEVSYSPGMGFNDQDFVNESPSSITSVVTSSDLDDSIKLPYRAEKIMVFDLETTGLAANAEILQIGAICDTSLSIFISSLQNI